jgi:hypothetical protein
MRVVQTWEMKLVGVERVESWELRELLTFV